MREGAQKAEICEQGTDKETATQRVTPEMCVGIHPGASLVKDS